MNKEENPMKRVGTRREIKIFEAQAKELAALQETGNPVLAAKSAGLLLDEDQSDSPMLTDTSDLSSENNENNPKNVRKLFG